MVSQGSGRGQVGVRSGSGRGQTPREEIDPWFVVFDLEGTPPASGSDPGQTQRAPSGPVSRILSPGCPGPRSFLSTRSHLRVPAADPEMVRARRNGTGALQLPIWPCSAWGLPCLHRCRRSGALLPHRFTLTVLSARSAGRFIFCGTFLRVTATGRYPACRPFGVRTFLPDRSGRSRGPLGATGILSKIVLPSEGAPPSRGASSSRSFNRELTTDN